jgi:hypothetical protein
MLPVHLRQQALQQVHDEVMDAVRANPDDATLLARLTQAVEDLEAQRAVMRSLEVEWGFVAPPLLPECSACGSFRFSPCHLVLMN